MTMVVLFLRQCLIASKTKTREVPSRADVASSTRKVRKVDRLNEIRRTEDQDSWITQVSTGDCQSLFLTTRQIGTATSEHGVITTWKVANELVHKSNSAGSDDLFTSNILGTSSRGGTGQSHRDVIMNTHVEHDARLRDKGDVLASEVLVEDLYILLIKGNLSRLLGIHASEKLSHGRLPGSRPPDDESGVTFREIHCHIVEDRNGGTGRVCEGDINHLKLASTLGRTDLPEVCDLSGEGNQVGRVARGILGGRCFHHVKEGSHGNLALCEEEELGSGHVEITGGDKAGPKDGHDLARRVATFPNKF